MEFSMARNGTDSSTRITVLETQVEAISNDMTKLEEKIDSNYATLHHRISDMRDDFHKNIEEKHERVISKLDEQSKASSAQHAQIAKKIETFEKWRWMVMGGAIVIGYVLAHLKLEKLF